MPTSRRSLVPLALVLGTGLSMLAVRPAAAQHTHDHHADARHHDTDGKRRDAKRASVSARVNEKDSVSWIVPRQRLGDARSSLRTRDRHAALLLNDTTLVLQLTTGGLYHVTNSVAGEAAGSALGRALARMVGAGLTELLDHGIAYRLSELREARYDGGRLVLLDRDGKRVFEKVEINGRDLMEDFSPDEARVFVGEVNERVKRLR